MHNIIQFPKSDIVKAQEKKDVFEFHRERIERLLLELKYEMMRVYEKEELKDEEFYHSQILDGIEDKSCRKLEFRVYKSPNIINKK